MGAVANLAGVGFLIFAGLGLSELVGRNTGAAGDGPPVFSNGDLPAVPARAAPHVLRVAADAYGQFWIEGIANGTALRFLADTGATAIVFSKRDARRLGFDVDRLSWDGRASTANGIARTASAQLARLTVGPFTVVDVPVLIIEGELTEPLLGMTFLQRMNVSISDGTLTLRDGT